MAAKRKTGRIAGVVLTVLVLAACSGGGTPETTGMEAGRSVADATAAEPVSWEGCEAGTVCGEIIYVPIYSSVFHQEGRTLSLTATLSVHNVDLEHPIRLVRVRYYDTAGRPLKEFLEAPAELNPLQTRHFLITQRDTSGGTGANFLVHWVADRAVASPVVEAVMISTTSQQGLSFTTQGKVIQTFPGAAAVME